MKLAIIMTIHNRNDQRLKNCLRSLIAQNTTHDYEVLVVDYGSTDNLPQLIGELNSDKILYLHVDGDPMNVSHGNNVALQATEADYICVTDGYTVFQSNFVDSAIGEAGDNLILVCTSRQYYMPETYILQGEGADLDIVDDFESCLLLDGVGLGPPRSQTILLVMERQRLAEIRGYDEDLTAAEDIDILRRMLASGAFLARLDDDTSFIYQTFSQTAEDKETKGQAEQVCVDWSDSKAALRRKSPIRNIGREFGAL